MYSICAIVAAGTIAVAASAITISPAPAGETASGTNIPPMYDVHWGNNTPLPPEAEHALHTLYVCEYTPTGHAALQDMLDVLGKFSFTDNDRDRVQRAGELYGRAKFYETQGTCRWTDHQGYIYGRFHNEPGLDLSEVSCTTMPNGLCASIQPMKSKWEDEVVYSLLSDTDALLKGEIYAGQQWALIN